MNNHRGTQPFHGGWSAFAPNPAVKALSAYSGSGQAALRLQNHDGVAKLDWNESVHPPSPAVRRALEQYVSGGTLNWYPDVDATALRAALGKYTDTDPEWIRVFGGSDAALEYITRAFVGSGDEVLWCPPTYDNFRVFVEACGGRLTDAGVHSIWRPDVEGILVSLTPWTRLAYLVNPNNPTGTVYSRDEIADLLRSRPDVGYVIDEAYHEFSGETCVPLLRQFDNLIVVRSFSKAFGLAGLRVGYALARPGVLQWIDRIRVGKNTGTLAQVAALAALNDPRYLKTAVVQTHEAMASLSAKLESLGLEVRTTPANFLMVRVADPDSVCRHLADHRIFVRNRHHEPGLSGYIRITVGTSAATDAAFHAISRLPRHILCGASRGRVALRIPRKPEPATETVRRIDSIRAVRPEEVVTRSRPAAEATTPEGVLTK